MPRRRRHARRGPDQRGRARPVRPPGPGAHRASEIVAEATLEKVEGRRLVFTVTATDAAGLVGAGKVTRVVVERGDFLAKAR